LQVGDTGPAESTRQGNLQRVGLLFLGSRDNGKSSIVEERLYSFYLCFVRKQNEASFF
jgi:hypothetical protein